MAAPGETPLSVVADGSPSAGLEVEWEPSPGFRRLLAERDALAAENEALKARLTAPEGLDALSLYRTWDHVRFPDASPETADVNWDHGSARFHEAWEAVSSRATAAVAAVTAERDRLARLVATGAYFAETWAELLEALPDSYGCTMNCPEANAATEFLAAFGFGGTAREVAKAHAAHDTPEDEHYQGDAESSAESWRSGEGGVMETAP